MVNIMYDHRQVPKGDTYLQTNLVTFSCPKVCDLSFLDWYLLTLSNQ